MASPYPLTPSSAAAPTFENVGATGGAPSLTHYTRQNAAGANYDGFEHFVFGTQALEVGASGGIRFLFDRAKGAFRAGRTGGSVWDNALRGTSSVAFGENTRASATHTSVGGGFNNVAEGPYCTVSGGSGNEATDDYTTVGGGQNNAAEFSGTIAGGLRNEVIGLASFVGGGEDNVGGSNPVHLATVVAGGSTNSALEAYATVSGGQINLASANSSTVSGGNNNTASAASATVGGGNTNGASANSATVGGGNTNTASGGSATVGGGNTNTASGVGGTVPGGVGNICGGAGSLCAGRNARDGSFEGCFVFSDHSGSAVTAAAAREFRVRSAGGATFFSDNGMTTGVVLAASASAWAAVCDRAVKENFVPLSPAGALERVVRLPLYEYNYIGAPPAHVYRGPTAQDWHALFPSGKDPLRIDTMDLDGVALAAIQGLAAKLERTEELMTQLRHDLDALRAAV